MLFSLYINDIDDIAEGVSGAITGTAGVHVSHMLYADDLTLLNNEPRRISEFAKSHELKSRPHAMLWLSKVYGIPAGMYASQVWGTVYLSEGSEFGSQLQKRHLCSLRRILGVKNSTTNWAVLRECGQEPLQFFWFRASIRLFNSMLDSNSETLRRVLKADLHLASFDSSCWSAQVSNAFNGLQNSAMFKQKMLRVTQVPMQEFIAICVSDI